MTLLLVHSQTHSHKLGVQIHLLAYGCQQL